jgi:hypothetical protein
MERTLHGRYSFLHMSVDFNNRYNVGYAFINFVEVPLRSPRLRMMEGSSMTRYDFCTCESISTTARGRSSAHKAGRHRWDDDICPHRLQQSMQGGQSTLAQDISAAPSTI